MSTIDLSRGQVQMLVAYSESFKVPKYLIVPIINKMVGIAAKSGQEFACQYMKKMKVNFIATKAGNKPPEEWVVKNGIFSSLVTWSKTNHKRWSQVICLLQAYTCYYSRSVTPTQERKFLEGVTAQPIKIPQSITEGVVRAGNLYFKRQYLQLPRSHILNLPVAEKFAPHPNGRTYPEDQCFLESVNFVLKTHFGDKIRRKYKDIWNAVFEGIKPTKMELIKPQYHYSHGQWVSTDPRNYEDSVGRISFIQEAGFKLRAVANPARIYQSMLKPLGDNLFGKLKQLPWDCTHNQQKGFKTIQAYPGTKHSIDLSGATDYFPLSLQISLLKSLFLNHDQIDLFHDISRGPWFYRKGKISWTKGQPLGLYPSFASFALTHGMLLYSLNNFTHDDKFFVLGDDVIILDDKLYVDYISTMDILGCPISTNKSISSKEIGEFAGKVITKNSIITQLKWRQPSDDNFMDLVKNIGISVIPLLRPRQQKVCYKLLEVPDFMGGLGFNPKGLSLEERIVRSTNILKDKSGRGYLMDFNRIYQRIVHYDPSIFPTFDHFSVVNQDFDKKSLDSIRNLLPLMLKHYKVLGKNLFSINEDLPLLIEGSGSRNTLLYTLERQLN
jgi:hypothetical protein